MPRAPEAAGRGPRSRVAGRGAQRGCRPDTCRSRDRRGRPGERNAPATDVSSRFATPSIKQEKSATLEQVAARQRLEGMAVMFVLMGILRSAASRLAVLAAARSGAGASTGPRLARPRVVDRRDPHGLDAWDQRHGSRCLVSLLNTAMDGDHRRVAADRAGPMPPAACPGSITMARICRRSPAAKLRGLTSVVVHAEATGQRGR